MHALPRYDQCYDSNSEWSSDSSISGEESDPETPIAFRLPRAERAGTDRAASSTPRATRVAKTKTPKDDKMSAKRTASAPKSVQCKLPARANPTDKGNAPTLDMSKLHPPFKLEPGAQSDLRAILAEYAGRGVNITINVVN